MRPGQLLKSPLLTGYFGEARIQQLARQLRVLKLFPKGGKSISNTVNPVQAAILLYLLASDTTPGTLRVQLEILACLNDGDFFRDFTKIFKDKALMSKVHDVEVSTNIASIFARIRYTDGTFTQYNEPPKSIRNSCVIPGEFLQQYAELIATDFESTWTFYNDAVDYKLTQSPTADSIKKLADACNWDERIEVSLDEVGAMSDEVKTRINILKP